MMKLIILIVFLSSNVDAAEGLGKFVGQLGMTEGEVLVDNKPVKKNAPVREGSVIEVKKGKTTLLLGSGSVFHLAANSKMVVKQFGMRADSNKEGGDVDLRFGRTRALILNKGNEIKDVRIITRTATMGVRGTEVVVDAPIQGEVSFYTMEGKAVVEGVRTPSVEVKQNQAVSSSGAAPKMSVTEMKNDTKQMQITALNTPNDMKKMAGEGFDMTPRPGDIPFPRFDPILDRLTPVTIVPHFCSATGAANCP